MKLRLGRLHGNETLFILCIQVMLLMTGMGLVGPTLPQFALSFWDSIAMVGLAITGFGVARIIIAIPAGRIAGKFGRRPAVIAGPSILVVGSIGCALAHNFWGLLAFRFVQGLGSGMHSTVAMIMLADISVPANRGRVMSFYQSTILLGLVLGPIIGGFVAQHFGLRAPFWGGAFLAAFAALWAYFLLPETQEGSRLSETATNNDSQTPISNSGVGFKTLLWNISFLLICMIAFSILFMRTGVQYEIVPLLANDRLALSSEQIGMTLGVTAIMQFVGVLMGGRLSDRFGRKLVIAPACLIVAGSLVMLTQSYSYSFFLLSCVVMGLGSGIIVPIPAAYVADIIPRESYSKGISLYRTISDLGIVIGPILLGWFADVRGFNFPLFFNSVLLVLAVVLFQILAREPHGRFKHKRTV